MKNYLIYWPVLAQIAIPMGVLLLNAKRKAADRAAGIVDAKKSAMSNVAWSKPVVLTSNNLANQSQLPVLFYVMCLILAAINGVTYITLGLAWAFVISRYIHAYAHVTNNYIPVRFGAFLVGALVLLVLFVFTIIALTGVA